MHTKRVGIMGAARMLVTSSLLNGMVGPCLTLGPLTFVAVFLAIQSDSKLIEAALANIVAADGYADWLLAQRGTVSKDLDLEF